MYYRWSEQSIRWFIDASAYTRFHQKAAEVIVPFMNAADTLCDVGCGLGSLDLALASHVKSITAIDLESRVLDVFKAGINKEGIQNIRVVCADMLEDILTEHDVFLMSLFGTESEMERCFLYCRKMLIRIVNATNAGNLYPAQYRKTVKRTITIMDGWLKEKGLSYEKIETAFEFGQPLRSEQDARDFILYNAPEASSHEITQFLYSHAQYTGNSSFPIYLPNQKKIGIYIIKLTPNSRNHFLL